ncbi:IclR family transcriptional regulator C-terminal domain-containing protein [Nocardioides marmotae]|uniref:IclR family transcriptional regulator domain-containing protein n=1 Tax=Nocardioides marmotae TaxID=2663857 RepID=UPI001321EC3B|nr:IclR family transcriptional regulator C-terminal domain-containing protein [Nocardioides marmotae]MBC9734460.1 helix-turn-helix domain-containing protein [Nocardioides marmotae]MTB85560.1 helix-turn-helix domain-containing protein [Nocardioides marmotae]
MSDPLSDPSEPGDRDFIQSIAKGLLVLRSFSAERPTFTLAEMARETGLSRAAVRRVLLTLQSLGYVEVRGRQYAPLPKVLDLGYAFVSSAGLNGLIQAHLERLNEEIDEACSAGVLDDGQVVYVARAQTRRLLSAVMGVGARLNAASTAIGRVLLSGLDDEEVRRHLREHPAEAQTSMSITEPERLLEEVRQARLRGYAIADEELEIGFRAAAVPLRRSDGSIVAAINVGMHVSRVSLEEARAEIVPKMLAVADAIERDLAMHPMPF